MKICPDCGLKVKNDSYNFCPRCGSDLIVMYDTYAPPRLGLRKGLKRGLGVRKKDGTGLRRAFDLCDLYSLADSQTDVSPYENTMLESKVEMSSAVIVEDKEVGKVTQFDVDLVYRNIEKYIPR